MIPRPALFGIPICCCPTTTSIGIYLIGVVCCCCCCYIHSFIMHSRYLVFVISWATDILTGYITFIYLLFPLTLIPRWWTLPTLGIWRTNSHLILLLLLLCLFIYIIYLFVDIYQAFVFTLILPLPCYIPHTFVPIPHSVVWCCIYLFICSPSPTHIYLFVIAHPFPILPSFVVVWLVSIKVWRWEGTTSHCWASFWWVMEKWWWWWWAEAPSLLFIVFPSLLHCCYCVLLTLCCVGGDPIWPIVLHIPIPSHIHRYRPHPFVKWSTSLWWWGDYSHHSFLGRWCHLLMPPRWPHYLVDIVILLLTIYLFIVIYCYYLFFPTIPCYSSFPTTHTLPYIIIPFICCPFPMGRWALSPHIPHILCPSVWPPLECLYEGIIHSLTPHLLLVMVLLSRKVGIWRISFIVLLLFICVLCVILIVVVVMVVMVTDSGWYPRPLSFYILFVVVGIPIVDLFVWHCWKAHLFIAHCVLLLYSISIDPFPWWWEALFIWPPLLLSLVVVTLWWVFSVVGRFVPSLPIVLLPHLVMLPLVVMRCVVP